MDEVSRGLDEMALGSPDNNIPPPLEEGRTGVGVEACGCAELIRNDSVGDLSTPLHRCKGRHHLPIIGEEMQGDQLPRAHKPEDDEPDKKRLSEQQQIHRYKVPTTATPTTTTAEADPPQETHHQHQQHQQAEQTTSQASRQPGHPKLCGAVPPSLKKLPHVCNSAIGSESEDSWDFRPADAVLDRASESQQTIRSGDWGGTAEEDPVGVEAEGPFEGHPPLEEGENDDEVASASGSGAIPLPEVSE